MPFSTRFSRRIISSFPTLTTDSPKQTDDQPLQHIAIVGAGIAGLCTALSLVRTANIPASCITIYEPRPTLDVGQGIGIQINSGSAVLSREYNIDLSKFGASAHRAISTFITHPGSPTLFDIHFASAFKHCPYVCKDDGSVHFVAILREDLQRILNEQVVKLGVKILRGKRYGVLNVNSDKRLVLADGNSTDVAYDLIIGADGVKSTIRKCVVTSDESLKKARYTGVRVAWVLADRLSSESADEDSDDKGMDELIPFGELRQYVGDGGTTVGYALNKDKNMLAFLYREKKSSRENVSYSCDENGRREWIAKRMRDVKAPEALVKQFEYEGERFIESSVYEHASLPNWSQNGIVLVGDAAHAMAPFLGQGANQCIQDAHMLGVVLGMVGKEHPTVDDALRAYEDAFIGKVRSIKKKSRLLGFLLTQGGTSGYMLRKALLSFAKGTGFVEKDLVSAFQPRF